MTGSSSYIQKQEIWVSMVRMYNDVIADDGFLQPKITYHTKQTT